MKCRFAFSHGAFCHGVDRDVHRSRRYGISAAAAAAAATAVAIAFAAEEQLGSDEIEAAGGRPRERRMTGASLDPWIGSLLVSVAPIFHSARRTLFNLFVLGNCILRSIILFVWSGPRDVAACFF